MTSVGLALLLAVGLCGSMTLAWAIATRTGQSGWIDAIWSFAVGIFGVVAALVPIASDEISPRQWLVAALVAVWSIRLGGHIARRSMHGGDDPRYRKLKEEWGDRQRSRLFWFLQIQAAVGLVLAVALAIAARRSGALDIGDWLGVVIFAAAIGGEAVADRQLARFRSDPANRGEVCTAGLWGMTRHPNYFFEWLVWAAYVPIATGFSDIDGLGLLVLSAPALMYWLLVHVSGIPPLEEHMLASRGEAFARYQASVNAFWPGPKRSILTSSR
ncbi:putative membrane protein [Hartmannibacter diazotrophicus]|uniref:Putative membrane protein n=1 Tax=Hartmannibacter diazotrophicus TaxID=1482074 RepID=A0A2C9D5P8_9HYPH|nr:DUF1295 domain-containing protein [Hartmannibacter diazotrophicus]SON55637.1 putative membrane protein [Hartmannibacter diazotrophicus]